MATLKDVADRANVSIATVSRVLNNKTSGIRITEKTRKRVIEAAQELDYQPNKFARSLRMGKTLKHILFIYFVRGEDEFFRHPFYNHMLYGVQLEAAKRGYYLSYVALNEETEDAVLNLLDGAISGVISWGTIPEEIEAHLMTRRLPLIAIEPYQTIATLEHGSIYVDNNLVLKQALSFLANLGHRRIAFISESDGELPQFEERRLAFEKWQAKLGLPSFPHQQVLLPRGLRWGGHTRADIEGLVPWVMAPKGLRPTALVASNDLMALWTMRLLEKLGLTIPHDLSVMGVDDIDLASYNKPALTTIKIPQAEMGVLAITLLDELLEKGTLGQTTLKVKTELILRETVKDLGMGGLACE